MAMGLLGYAVAGAGEGLGQGIAATGFEAMKQAMEQNRQAALLQMREEMDIAKEKRGQDIKIADRGLVWNTDLMEALELDNLLMNAAITMHSAEKRK